MDGPLQYPWPSFFSSVFPALFYCLSLESIIAGSCGCGTRPPSPREGEIERETFVDQKSQTASMPQLKKLYTMAEASQHNTKDDCWVVIDGKVYDVSSYLDEHPGGDDVVLAATGRDATEDFEDAGHSKSAKELMESFCIGELDDSAIPELEIISKQPRDYAHKLVELTKQYWVVPTAVVGISLIVGFLYLCKK